MKGSGLKRRGYCYNNRIQGLVLRDKYASFYRVHTGVIRGCGFVVGDLREAL